MGRSDARRTRGGGGRAGGRAPSSPSAAVVATTGANGSATDIAQGLAQLAAALRSQAPTLAPCTVPSDGPVEVVLSQLYKDEEDSAHLLGSLKDRAAAACGRSDDSAELRLHLEWDVDVARRRKAPARVLLLDRCGSTIRDLPRLIEFLTAQQVARNPNDVATSELVRRFLSDNGHDVGDAHRLQDAVSVAYAMLVLHKELRLVGVCGPPLQQLLDRSFPGLPAPVAMKIFAPVGVGPRKGRRALGSPDVAKADKNGAGTGWSAVFQKKKKRKKRSMAGD